ncbi:MAG: hypothetical protein VYC31_07070 [Pseudomonadota bacterium]|nr:hypothetical protein [Pseudomonadota bacterium]
MPVLFAVGIAVYFELPVELPPPVAGLLALALGGALAAARLWPRGDLMFLALATTLAGVLAAWLATWRVAAPVLAETGWHDIDGRVVDISRTGAGARLILDDVRLGTVPSARPRRGCGCGFIVRPRGCARAIGCAAAPAWRRHRRR